jgi:putative ABC transport system permease protein
VGVVENVVMQSPFLPVPESLAFRFDSPPDERQRRYVLRVRPGLRDAVSSRVVDALGPARADREVVVAPFDSKAGKHHAIGRGVALEMAMIGATVGAGAVIGALALSSFLVRQRRRQIGIRRALGATKADIVRYFFVESSVAAAAGTAIGLLMTLALLLLGGLLQGEGDYFKWDWRSLAAAALLLWGGATLAAMLPARSAAEVPPSVASRGL